ncbi:hypothetical protein JCM17844_22610 [Iodidimonas gelatinilytica]|uniref:Putative auto-transporter adhesin head GIN domain-containing protein n=1 Tax=Iodidimonas gelatinilytica TaxID=1236966 RepID=A0A5A7MSI0_9PROT|nr:DUF2807 domain-containing protein [Iodidimonas gelatinilytica]GEQ98624.1 hypothetical protein JCM17844_22610 [Iodidimonas gelatinilytica]
MTGIQNKRTMVFGGVIAAIFAVVVVASFVAPSQLMEEIRSEETIRITLSGEDISQTRDISMAEFNRVRLVGHYDVELVAGKPAMLKIEGDKAVLNLIKTKIVNDELLVEPKGKLGNRGLGDVKMVLHLPSLTALTLDGATSAQLMNLDSENLMLTINGAGDIESEGRCGTLIAVSNGAADVDARDLRCKTVQLTINGAGQMSAYATDSAMVAVNGVGEVDVYGNPKNIRKVNAGFGDITFHDMDDEDESAKDKDKDKDS